MNKTKYILIAAIAVFSLMFWGSRSIADTDYTDTDAFSEGRYAQWDDPRLDSLYVAEHRDTFEASQLLGYQVYSPDYWLGNLGQITDLLIDRCNGQVAFVIVSDTPGFGSESLVVPFGALKRAGEHTFQVDIRGRNVPVGNSWDHQQGDRFAQFLAMNRDIVGLDAMPETSDSAWANNVYEFYGVSPYWSDRTTDPEIVSYSSYRMTESNEDVAFYFPDGNVVAFYGAAPYWTTCGGSCGPEAMSFAGVTEPPMPSDARPGECYVRVFVPPRCEKITEQVLVSPGSERVEHIPARYETVEERVMVKPSSKRIEEIPAEYKTVEEKVLVEPARTEWREGRGAVEKMDPATGKIMCLVEIPARYETVKKEVLVSPATTREVEIPAEYEMRKVEKMVEPAQEKVIEIPAEYKMVEKTQKVTDGYFEWKKVEGCQPK